MMFYNTADLYPRATFVALVNALQKNRVNRLHL